MRSCTRRASRSEHRTLSLPAVCTALLVLALPARRAGAQDQWLGPDKFLHFMGGFLVTSISYTVAVNAWDWDHDRARMFGAATGVAVSIGKELYDSFSGRGHVSGKDLFWDGIGIGTGMAVINQLKSEPAQGTAGIALWRGMISTEFNLRRPCVSGREPLFRPALRPSLKAVDTTFSGPTLRIPALQIPALQIPALRIRSRHLWATSSAG